MLVKGLFTNVSGSIGGVTGSRNKGGQYLRARVTPVNPNTIAQQQARTRFTEANEAWGAASNEIKSAWEGFSEIQTATNRLGDAITLSGQNAFIGSYATLEAAGLATVTDPPSPNTQPASYEILAFTFDGSSTILTPVAFVAGDLTAADRFLIGISPILPPGVSRYKGPFRNLESIAGNSTGNDIADAIEAAYVARNPGPSPGAKVAVRIISVRADGAYSSAAIRVSNPSPPL